MLFSDLTGKLVEEEDETAVLACYFLCLDGESYGKQFKLDLCYIAPPEIQ